MSAAPEQVPLDDDGVWDAIDTLDRARTAYYERTGRYTGLGDTEKRERARRYLLTMDRSVQGQNGSAKLWRAAITLVHGFDIDAENVTEMLIDWNAQCDPPWSVAELQRAAWRANRASERQPRGYLLRGRT
jgi:hypothetical protein